MRTSTLFCLCVAAGCVLLQARTVGAQTDYLYTVSIDEDGHGYYVEYSPASISPTNVIASGSLPWRLFDIHKGIMYELPFLVNSDPMVTKDLAVTGADGVSESDLLRFANTNYSGGPPPGTLVGTVYILANYHHGDLADVFPDYWWDDWPSVWWSGADKISLNADGTATYTTVLGSNGIPGDPSDHPSIEADYTIVSNGAQAPEPSTLALLVVGAIGLVGYCWRATGLAGLSR